MVDTKKVSRILWILLFFYLVSFPFGQLSRLPINFGNLRVINLYITDLIIGVVGVIWGVCWFGQKKKIYPPFFKELSFFGISLLFSFLFAFVWASPGEVIVAGLYLVRIFAYGLFYCATWSLVKNVKDRNLLLSSLVVVGVAFAILGLIQYFVFPDFRLFTIWGWDEHYMRLVGTFLDPGFTAIILVFSLLLIVLKFSLTPQGWKPRSWWILASGALTFSALLFTYSRAGYLALIAGMAVLGILRRNIFIFLLPPIILVGGIFLIPKNTTEGTTLARSVSSLARFESWKSAIKLWKTSPVFGVGFNFYRNALERNSLDYRDRKYGATGSDSSLLFILATGGVVGVLLFVNLLGKIISVSLESESYRTVLLSSLSALLIHSLFLNSLFYPHVLGWIAILFALSNARFTGRRLQ